MAEQQRTARALVYFGQHGVLEERVMPIPGPKANEALVRVTACTLCGSDLHSLHGRRTVPTPTILGHEILGRLVAWGENFPRADISGQALQLGDRVTWAVVAACGHCYYCRRQLPQKCEHACKYGHMGFDSSYVWSGGLAEFCVLAPGTALVKIPEAVPDERIAPASCATATVMAALELLPSGPIEHVIILGAGMLGLTATAVLHQRGVATITVVDPQESRLQAALRCGATRTHSPVNLQDTQLAPADAVLEFSGSETLLAWSLDSLRMGGRLILVGAVFPVPAVELLPERIVRRQLTITGVHNYRPEHLLQAVEFLVTHGGKYPLDEFVSGWHDLQHTACMLRNGPPVGLIRIGVRP